MDYSFKDDLGDKEKTELDEWFKRKRNDKNFLENLYFIDLEQILIKINQKTKY
jgi:hypothetical protein